jgi:blue light- and temperature-responsive anti-repressor
MASELYRIVYCSRNLIPVSAKTDSQDGELDSILQASRRNNPSEDVTGALLFNDGCFAQVLEGPRPSVERIFERIQRDRRHGQVTVVDNGFSDRRDFPNWAMAHVQPPAGVKAEGIGAKLQLAMIQPHESGADVLGLLKDLVIQD